VAEKALEESEQRYALVIDASEQGILDWNIETNEVFYSKQWKKQIGYENDEIENNFDSWIDHLHPDEKEDCRRAIQAYLNNPVEHFFLEFRFRHKDGSYRWIYNKAASILNENGKVVRMFGSHTDITDKKNADIQIKNQNEELHKLNATKSKFFSIIAHDLKSPFNSIMGFSEILVTQSRKKNYNDVVKYAEIILLSSRRAINLLTNLMEWARTQTGQIKFCPKRFDLTAFMLEATQMFDDIAGQKKIEIKKEIREGASVFADQEMVNTVLRNLISNAIKFTKPGGKITISVQEEKNECIVAVKDNGIGIPNAQINKLFRIDKSYSTRGTANETGTGLGLILCKEFVEKHHGKIWVESEERKGSTFYFTLPYHAEPAA
jgi:PAS domain S-box-containing protein